MRLALSVGAGDRPPVDVVVDVDDDGTVAVLSAALAQAAGVPDSGLHLDGVRLDDEAPLSETGVVDGCLLQVGPSGRRAFQPPLTGWQLHVVSGPDSGGILELPVGVHELGRSGALAFTDRSMSRRHAVLRVSEDGAALADLGSANGTLLDGEPVPVDTDEDAVPVPVRPGAVIALGDTLLTVVSAQPDAAAVERGTPGTLAFVRPPRLLPSTRTPTLVLPTPPEERPPRKFPLVMVVMPLALGVVMAFIVGNPLYLMFAVASPVMAVSNTVSERRQGSKELRKAKAEHAEALKAVRAQLADGLQAESVQRRDELPDAAAVLLTATRPTRRLWERRRPDPDALVLRVGTATLPAALTVQPPRGEDPASVAQVVHDVPVPLPLREVGVLGVAGPKAVLPGVLRWLVLQLGVHHPPRDLAITLLAPRSESTWAWVRWLPHCRTPDGEGPAALVGNDADTVAARVAELGALVKARRELVTRVGRVEPDHFPAHVVVLDGARQLRTTPGLAGLLADGPSVGVYAVCADEEERFLPEACTATLVLDAVDPARATLRRTGEEPVEGLLTEQVGVALATTAARALAPLRDVSSDQEDVVLPDAVRLLDVLGLEPPTPDVVRSRWQLKPRSTRMVVGAGLDGAFALDLRSDGPHGLIAGTTGAGKSELLQTMIASLAVANRPDQLNFVLVDYKGGSAFKDCVVLPHTVGMVTDLDAHLVQRALTSLGAELKVREHWLADAGKKDIEDYTELQEREPHRTPMPRLLIVIDEFASMARELPEFVTGLVNIAQRGRSLGIHLLLATQRPSGVVSPEIRANTNLRISLRVTDGADSQDVIETPDASRIPKSAPGRGYARLGHGALSPFQAARVGGRRPGVRATKAPAPFVVQVGWPQLGYAAPQAPPRDSTEDDELTDLSVLVGALREAAVTEAVPVQRSPWLPALPESVVLDDLGPAALVPGTVPVLPFGLSDLPDLQEQRVAGFDPAADGHLMVIGSSRSGRSQLLRTLAASVARLCSTADLHVYGLDCGNGALLPLQDLPHCGAVVTRSQVERVVRLFGRLQAETERRQALLAESGFGDISEQRRSVPEADRLPHLLLLLDRWEGFTATLGDVDGGRLTDTVLALLREGASVGVHCVLTGDRSLASGRIASLTDNKLVLRLADKGDYGFVGLNPKQLPDEMPAGRAFAAGVGTETQVALLTADASGQAQGAVLADLAGQARARDTDVPRALRPFRVDLLPSRIRFDAALAMHAPTPSGRFALVGVGGDELAAVGPDFATGASSFVVAGPGKSGKSTLLAVMASSLLEAGVQVLIGAPRPSPLRDLAGRPGVLEVVTDVAAPEEVWTAALDRAGGAPLVVLLDDGEVLKDCPAAAVFRDVVKGLRGEDVALVLGGNAEGICTGLSGWQVEVKKGRQGVLLSPQGGSDGDLIGLRLPRSLLGQPVQPGRGLVHLGDSVLLSVTVPSLTQAPVPTA